MREQGSQTETETAPVMSSSRQHEGVMLTLTLCAACILSPQRAGLAPPCDQWNVLVLTSCPQEARKKTET